MNSQLLNMGLVLVLVQVSRKLNLEDEGNKQYVQMAYVTSNALILALSFFIMTRIKAKNDTTPLTYTEPKPMAQEQTEITTTVRDYDLGELQKQVKQTLISVAILGFIHYKWGYIQPLFLQSILPLKSACETKLFKVHILNKPAEGDLQRPWKVESPFGNLAAPTNEAAPAAADNQTAAVTDAPSKKAN
ncbi:inorganic phosphate transporter [Basidiobolus meristosporus CBS 931.73]|uniref:Inorganic phosphate transporter n=1 Tax=Basidiobolus meristosporus CBS 931.73 TaxID=1314790 RepID=A0A1Y1XUQ3_9FUNG|nr:inorganic phosphate transporter [Basidiobolus meristosporus CBS 931.73]|eukprot:ORX89470.1 inorganic phosphate transporter [Basidiobolus meristosporus CBS 931.73]